MRLMRAPDDQALLRRYFDLRVGYVGTLVNQHAIELYLLDADARVEHVWTRTRWDVDDVLKVLRLGFSVSEPRSSSEMTHTEAPRSSERSRPEDVLVPGSACS